MPTFYDRIDLTIETSLMTVNKRVSS